MDPAVPARPAEGTIPGALPAPSPFRDRRQGRLCVPGSMPPSASPSDIQWRQRPDGSRPGYGPELGGHPGRAAAGYLGAGDGRHAASAAGANGPDRVGRNPERPSTCLPAVRRPRHYPGRDSGKHPKVAARRVARPGRKRASRRPIGAVRSFLDALSAKDSGQLAEADRPAILRPRPRGPMNRKSSTRSAKGSLDQDDLDELAKELEGYKVRPNNLESRETALGLAWPSSSRDSGRLPPSNRSRTRRSRAGSDGYRRPGRVKVSTSAPQEPVTAVAGVEVGVAGPWDRRL